MSDSLAGFLPLSVPVIRGNELSYVAECLESGWVSGGAFVERFEAEMASRTGAAHAVACQSGTAALHLSLVVLGIGHGDAVICPTLTFIATANAIVYTGARPVLLGCDTHLNLDPEVVEHYLTHECSRASGGELRDRSTGLAVKAILPVHVFGNPCDMVALRELAERFNLLIVEDAAESLGSSWTEGPLAGSHTGTVGRTGCFSFNGNKVVTAGGGGCVITSDERLASRIRHLATTAKTDAVRFVHDEVGYNYRLTNISAAVAVGQLEQLDGFLRVKRANFERYREGLGGVPGVALLDPPAGTRPNHWFYAIEVNPASAACDRDGLMARLSAEGIDSRPVWELVHRQSPYSGDRAFGVERAEHYQTRVLNVPCSSDLTKGEVDRVVAVVRSACERGA